MIFLHDWGGIPSLRRELQTRHYGVLCHQSTCLDPDADDPEMLQFAKDKEDGLIVLTDDKDIDYFIKGDDDQDPGIELKKDSTYKGRVEIDTSNASGTLNVRKTNHGRWKIQDEGSHSHNGVIIYEQQEALNNPDVLADKIDSYLSNPNKNPNNNVRDFS